MAGTTRPAPARGGKPAHHDWFGTPAKLALISGSLVLIHATLAHLSSTPNAQLGPGTGFPIGRLVKRGFGMGATNSGEGDHASASLIDWQAIYTLASPHQRPFICLAMVLWLVFLFAFVGITASVSQQCWPSLV